MGEIFDFSVYPFGNAKESGSSGEYTFTCQHGTPECEGNMYEACAINQNNGTDASTNAPYYWPFLVCMEQGAPESDAEKCAQKGGLNYQNISACAGTDPAVGSAEGNALMHQMALITGGLNPPHQFTPWVTINGKPLTGDQTNEPLTRLVCDAYTGTKPARCKLLEEEDRAAAVNISFC